MRQFNVAEVLAFVFRLLRLGLEAVKKFARWFRVQPNKVRVPLSVCAAVVLLWIFWPSKPTTASAAVDPYADEVLFDPGAEGADKTWGEEVQVSSAEVRELTEKANRVAIEFPKMLDRCQSYDRRIASVVQLRGEVWAKHVAGRFVSSSTPSLFYDLAKDQVGVTTGFEKTVAKFQMEALTAVINARVAVAQVYLVGGRARIGDKMFIRYVSNWIDERDTYLKGQEKKLAEFNTLWARESK